MPQFSDDIFLGPAVSGGAPSDGPSPMTVGVGPLGRVYIFDVVPVALDLDGLAASQAVLAAGNLVLTAGLGVTTSVVNGETRLVLDTPRTVIIDSDNAGDTTQTATVFGYDVYGQSMSEVIAFNGLTAVAGQKAFKSVTRIAISAALTGLAIVGFTDVLGLPVRVTNAGYIVSVKWDGVLAADAGTFAAADVTSPATTTTNDVRGTYLPSSVADGSKRLVIAIAVPAIGSGPNATRVGAFGVTQA
jgi:hypothetical protein